MVELEVLHSQGQGFYDLAYFFLTLSIILSFPSAQ